MELKPGRVKNTTIAPSSNRPPPAPKMIAGRRLSWVNISAAPPAHRTAKASKIAATRSEEHTSELQSLMRISYAVFCLKKKTQNHIYKQKDTNNHEKDKRNT